MSDQSGTSSEAESSKAAQSPIATKGRAPLRSIPRATFAAVEYPGTVSHPSALLKVITQENLNDCFNTPWSKESAILEMSYRMDDKASVPVRGLRAASSKLLLRIRRRRRKKEDVSDDEEQEEAETQGQAKGKGKGGEQGVFTADIVGAVTATARFRHMADYHYTPDPEGRLGSLVTALRDLDYDTILDYTVPQLEEEWIEPVEPPLGEDLPPDFIPFRSRLELLPPPLLSQRVIPPQYGYKPSIASVREQVIDQHTGETRWRLVNKSRLVDTGPQKVGQHIDKVPTQPSDVVKSRLSRLDPGIKAKLLKLFADRPIWLRHALLAQFTIEEIRRMTNEKTYFASCCYSFGAGPFWKCYVRLGYDPRQEPSSHIYQRIYFYIAVQRAKNTMLRQMSDGSDDSDSDEEDDEGPKTKRKGKGKDKDGEKGEKPKGWWEEQQELRIAAGERGPLDRTKGHLFDGVEIHRDKPDFQLCDITDPLVRKYIDDPTLRTDICDPKDGWYKPAAMAVIKNICRIKYLYVREHGEAAPNEQCYEEIEKFEREMKAEREKRDKSGTAVLEGDGTMAAEV